jgi:hypothetical protein
MLRITALLSLSLVALGGANAGNITAIDLNTVVGSVANSCPTGSAVGGTCAATNVNFSSGSYLNNLFSTIVQSGAPTPGPTAQFPTNAGLTGTPFILDTSANNSPNNTYQSPNNAGNNTSIVIDMGGFTGANATAGLFGIDKIWTMIQSNGQAFNFQGVTITLNGVASDGVTAITDQIQFKEGRDYRSTLSTGIACTDANSVNGAATATGTACAGMSSDLAQVSGTETQTVGGATNTVITYNSVFGGALAGKDYYLDVQEIDLPGFGNTGSFVNGYLDSITIANSAPNNSTSSRLMFSALTVDQATPEPGTVFLLGTGLGLLAFLKLRSKATA